ncbi:DNA gyrase alpha subunit [Alteracholeplasma palmae J233]|uniref:DNA gyrase subunit A n=1 Tax=Alteracholeplasma palmae (strain ATCC 49389 / J233) TaxID=1318466 RepID=U4KJI7_ALTPJ|nr:DNA gyrase subunit A [Alteracholeplasma palmae]CCV63584.1 DNA gyrase alpha subunit [Alteracholeplasma palmae J233]
MSEEIKDDFETSKTTEGHIKEVNISSEMRKSFLSYAMSVIVSRALPDIRDGLKPVQRRILYGMNELGVYSNSSYKKSARIVGDVMGKYHPHGDSSIYEAMVRMSQDFSYRYPLVDGHGNFGSIDGDGAAAMRYTEARMSKIAMEMLRDIDKNTIDFIDNYDASEKEPAVLPARYPNLLVNGSTGIAVGMATNIPPHDLGEVVDGLLAYIDNKDITVDELMEYIKGPDFPTGGQILGLSGLRAAYRTGNGIIAIRAKAEIQTHKNKNSIVVTEIPYQVNKTKLIERIAELAKDKIIEGITDLRDESNRKGMRIVIELRRDVNPHVMLNNLYKYTQLQVSFGMNMIALVKGEPKTVTLKDMLEGYFEFQMEVIQRRTQYELEKAEARIHIINALVKALNDVDRAVELIKTSKDGEEAKQRLIETYDFDDIQAKAILDMRLQRLTSLEILKIKDEAEELRIKIEGYNEIIASHERKEAIIKEEITEIRNKYDDGRKSEINLYEDLDIDNEDLIPVEDILITVTNNGYIKRMSLDNYKAQNRGGVGITGIKMHEDDYVEHMAMTQTHDYHLFFTNKGRVYKIKGYQIPVGSRQAKGLPIINLLPFEKDETLTSFTSVKDFDDQNQFLFFVTKKGIVKRTPVSDYKNIRTNGIIALTLREDDELLSVRPTNGNKDIILGASNGKAIRFNEADVRSMGRTASGVKGMAIDEKDDIVGIALVENEDQEVLVVTENGFGKRTHVSEYRSQNRGGKGVKTLNVTEKNGKLATLRAVTDDQDLIVSSDKGITIRTHIAQIAETKRATQGVRIIKLRPDHKVATIALVPHQDEEEIVDPQIVTQEEIEIKDEKKVVETVTLSATSEENIEEEKEVTQIDIFDKE